MAFVSAPPLHRVGPLLGDVVLSEPLQGADELAVHEPGRERIEVPRDRRHPSFVEQRQALPRRRRPGCAAAPPPPVRRRTRQGRRSEPTSMARSGPLPSPLEVAGQHPLVGADDRQPCVRRRLLPSLEQAVRPREPAAHRRHQRGVQQQVHRDANRCARRRDGVAGLHAERIRALPRLDGHVEMAGRVGDLGEQGQIGRTQEPVRVGLHEELVARLPIPARRRFSRARDAHRTPP